MDQKIESVIDKINVATTNRKVEWQPQSNGYFAALGDSRVTLLLIRELYYLMIFNSAGQEIVRVTSAESSKIKPIYKTIEKQALKVDETLGDLDKLLGDMNK